MDVGCILSDNSEGNIEYKFTTKKNGTQTIPSSSDLVEPLCYTLLFPFGERGWSKGLCWNNIVISITQCIMLRNILFAILIVCV